jgi:hypothetical protein
MKNHNKLLLTAALLLFAFQNLRADELLPLAHFDHAYQRVETLLAAAPSGTTLDKPQFEPAVGADVLQYLTILGVQSIDSLNGQITLNLPAVFNGRTPGGSKVQVEKQVRFTYRPDQSGIITLENVSGIKIKPLWILGWMPLKQVKVKKDGSGNTIFEAQVDALGITVTKTKIISPDGKVLP